MISTHLGVAGCSVPEDEARASGAAPPSTAIFVPVAFAANLAVDTTALFISATTIAMYFPSGEYEYQYPSLRCETRVGVAPLIGILIVTTPSSLVLSVSFQHHSARHTIFTFIHTSKYHRQRQFRHSFSPPSFRTDFPLFSPPSMLPLTLFDLLSLPSSSFSPRLSSSRPPKLCNGLLPSSALLNPFIGFLCFLTTRFSLLQLRT